MKKLFSLLVLTSVFLFCCKKDVQETSSSIGLISQIEHDSLFFEWAKAGSGRWINYSFERIDRKSLTKENVFVVLNSSITQIHTARKHYENLLLAKYGSGMFNFKESLDSLYRKNYDQISYSLRMRNVMDDLYAKYGNLTEPQKNSRVMGIGKLSYGDLEEVVITACGIPNDLLQFYNIYLKFPLLSFTPPGSSQNVINCRVDALNRVSSSINSLRNTYATYNNCWIHKDEAYLAMEDYFNCDPLEPYPGWSPFDPFSGGGGGAGSGATFNAEQWELNFKNKIDTTALVDCFKKGLKAILNQNNSMASIVKSFTATLPDFPGHNWKLVTGTLGANINGLTTNYDQANSRVVTTFDPAKFTDASDLSVVRTLMHEAAHAYLISYFRNDPIRANADYPDLVTAWNNRNGNLNQIHHDQFVDSFVINIFLALREYGNLKGYTFSSDLERDQYYLDLAWGGLSGTTSFKNLPKSIKDRILDNLAIEQSGKDMAGNVRTQKGTKSGC